MTTTTDMDTAGAGAVRVALRRYRDSFSDDARFGLSLACGGCIALPVIAAIFGPVLDLFASDFSLFGGLPWWAWVGIDTGLVAVAVGLWKLADWINEGVACYWDWEW